MRTRNGTAAACVHAVLLCASLGALALMGTPALAQELILSTPRLLTNKIGYSAEPASMLCVHPSDPGKIVAGFSEGQILSSTYPGNADIDHLQILSSEDGGESWASALRTHDKHWYADPACTYSRDGAIIVTTMKYRVLDEKTPGRFDTRGYHILRSTDQGKTWVPSQIDYSQWLDRGFIVTDTVSSPYRGRVYLNVLGATFGDDLIRKPLGTALFTSIDGGATFTGPATVDAGLGPALWKGAKGIVHSGPAAILEDGTVIAAWYNMYGRVGMAWEDLHKPEPAELADKRAADEQPGMSRVLVSRSRDGGSTLEAPVTVAKGIWNLNPAEDPIGIGSSGKGKFVPAIAADASHGPYRNRLYVAWGDLQGGRKQVWFSSSSDSARTWSTPRVISDDQPADLAALDKGPHSFQISMAANKNGVIGVFYYSQVGANLQFQAMLTVSMDGGSTWSAPKPVLPFDISAQRAGYSATAVRSRQGDGSLLIKHEYPRVIPACTAQITADAQGSFHMLAIGNPQDQQSAYHVKATVTGTAVPRRELSHEVTATLSPFHYDRKRQVYSTQLTLKNDAGDDLSLPITLVAKPLPVLHDLRFQNAGGYRLKFLNSHNGRTSDGAYWVIGNSGDAVLRPEKSTTPQTIELERIGIAEPAVAGAQSFGLSLQIYN